MKRVYGRIKAIKGQLIVVEAYGCFLGELAVIESESGTKRYGSVIKLDQGVAILQLYGRSLGVSTHDRVTFLNQAKNLTYAPALLGRQFSGFGTPIDGGPAVDGESVRLCAPSYNPVRRIIPRALVRTNVPMIDMFNCLVRSQKIPVFSKAGEPYNALLCRIANQTDADAVVIGGLGLTFEAYQQFVHNMENEGALSKTVMFIHQATDPVVECLLALDMALACAQQIAAEEKNVLVLLTDMTAYADALKEIAIGLDQIPSNRGYPGSLYSDLAARYEKAVELESGGSITIISATTMPGDDVTHPVPDNTGYITEGQFYLRDGMIDPFGSLSRLKQLVIGKETREDHGDLANTMVRIYAEAKVARERAAMGFQPSRWDQKLISYADAFEDSMMNLCVNLTLEDALARGWQLLARYFDKDEVGMKRTLIEKYWP